MASTSGVDVPEPPLKRTSFSIVCAESESVWVTELATVIREELYRLVETFFEDVKGEWEERFERRYGFWRGLIDEQVRRYLDCGLFENGFARVQCPDCHAEYLLPKMSDSAG